MNVCVRRLLGPRQNVVSVSRGFAEYKVKEVLLSSPKLTKLEYFQVIIGKRISGICQNLTEKIINPLLSLKVPGEEYSVIKSDHQSTILGKQESHELNQLTIKDGNVSFELPSLDDKALQRMFGNISEIGVEVCMSTKKR